MYVASDEECEGMAVADPALVARRQRELQQQSVMVLMTQRMGRERERVQQTGEDQDNA